MQVYEAIRSKRAVRLFAETPISEEATLQILDAGRRSQSSKNGQPWHFIVVRDRDTLQALSQTGKFAGHLSGATMAVVLVGTPGFNLVMFDLGQAAAYMQLAAWELGIGSCLAAIYEPDKARKILGVPSEMSCDVAISFGYPSPQHVPMKLGGRKVIENIVHWEKW